MGSESGISCYPEQTSLACINTACSSVHVIDRYCLDHCMVVHEEALVIEMETSTLSVKQLEEILEYREERI